MTTLKDDLKLKKFITESKDLSINSDILIKDKVINLNAAEKIKEENLKLKYLENQIKRDPKYEKRYMKFWATESELNISFKFQNLVADYRISKSTKSRIKIFNKMYRIIKNNPYILVDNCNVLFSSIDSNDYYSNINKAKSILDLIFDNLEDKKIEYISKSDFKLLLSLMNGVPVYKGGKIIGRYGNKNISSKDLCTHKGTLRKYNNSVICHNCGQIFMNINI